jgi:hypothetical protein
MTEVQYMGFNVVGQDKMYRQKESSASQKKLDFSLGQEIL